MPTPTPEPTVVPTLLPTPEPTERAHAIAYEWAVNDADTVAQLVADAEEQVPALLRVSFGGLLKGIVADEMGNALGVEVESLAHHGDAIYSVTLAVSGTVVVEIGPVEAVDLAVPIVVTVDLDSEQATTWEANSEQVEVTIR